MYCITSTRREVMQYIQRYIQRECLVHETNRIYALPMFACRLRLRAFYKALVENEAMILLILQYHNRHAQQSVHKSGWGSLSQLTLELVEGIRGASSLASPVLVGGKLTLSSCTRRPVEA